MDGLDFFIPVIVAVGVVGWLINTTLVEILDNCAASTKYLIGVRMIDWTEVVPASVKNLIFPLLPTSEGQLWESRAGRN